MRKIRWIAVVLLLIPILSACGGESEPEKKAESEQTEETEKAAEADTQNFWDSSWYGWWMTGNCEGICENLDGILEACCGVTELPEGEEEGLFMVWDQYGNRSDFESQLCNGLVVRTEGETENGALVSKSGFFWDQEIGEGEWVMDPGLDSVSKYDPAIAITGTYEVSNEDGTGSFDYVILLRPWGISWDDMDPGLLPPGYEEFYVPLLEAGEEMPSSME